MRRALIELIDNHDEGARRPIIPMETGAESYKEYIEVFARSLKETMESAAGVSYLLRAVGFDVPPEEVNLHPECAGKSSIPHLTRKSFIRRLEPGAFAFDRRKKYACLPTPGLRDNRRYTMPTVC